MHRFTFGLPADDDLGSQPAPPVVSPAKVPQPRVAKRAAISPDDSKQMMHITDQFRDGASMVYDLKAGLRRIEIRISTAADARTLFQVGVRNKDTGAASNAAGTTRRAALDALREQSDGALSGDDWRHIGEALTAVSALR